MNNLKIHVFTSEDENTYTVALCDDDKKEILYESNILRSQREVDNEYERCENMKKLATSHNSDYPTLKRPIVAERSTTFQNKD